ncbi:hypothetical protein [Brevibacterium casei]|nr:hypothetical protein [Brevibacterium casei]MBE4694340.1 hypothetical protein [Brevibacterium casei]MBY3577462.1 hypothetical protein [Brevibacterium casei]MCT1550728.1 hypothetical protein [Brevibacterium casei]MCT1559411.1 hypothetical protein [Brevibacterium casei]MCT1765097.1 hypothetical protein [Brevibacterium casei]
MTRSPRLRDDQVMERIVRPAVDRILRDGELDRLDIIEGRSRNLIDVRITVGDEVFILPVTVPRADDDEEIADMAQHFFDMLQDFVAESSFGWGELRGE